MKEVVVPDIGGAEGVDVIELLVSPGDTVNAEDSLITLESDKASMEIPAPFAGTVKEMKVALGDKVSEGDVILMLEVGGEAEDQSESTGDMTEAKSDTDADATEQQDKQSNEPVLQDVVIPDIGTEDEVDIIEVSVKPGDKIEKEDPLITLEGDKASMEVPSPFSGEVKDVSVNVGDKISQGKLILTMLVSGEAAPAAKPKAPAATSAPAAPAAPAAAKADTPALRNASPAVRRYAREFDIDISQIKGTGRKGRVTKDDLIGYVKGRMQGGGLPSMAGPKVDFTKFGDVETKPLSKIQKLSGANLHRNWVSIPHVTQFDEADITDMEAFRKEQKAEAEKQGFKLTPLVFIMKAVVAALKDHPTFNASLDPSGENLILKKYFHIGVAVDTPDGLVVPVIRDVDQKDLMQLAKELGEISEKARTTGLSLKEMQGSCFTISSLGGIGGTAFTPIVNAPDVAILGVSKSAMKPVFKDGEFVPRLMLPLSLSYDHRVIDGAEGARFSRRLVSVLSEIRTLLM
ncbi:MAG: dihydrolipoyllysine-residue acetyltransferase [Legionellales bacterium]|nr:dihydrolipoyllysine-residue acetyltransferase [Legionellales bacterium]